MATYGTIPVARITFNSDSHTGGGVAAKFDAFLYKPIIPDQLKLTIQLRINMRQMPPRQLPLVLDADGNLFWTSPWTSTDWQKFITAAAAQADMWNNKFWLLPPATFSDFDAVYSTSPSWAYRPNIRCELAVDFNAKNAHRTIDVANLNTNMLTGQPQNAGVFRSHALLYDSLDAVPWAFPLGEGPNQPAKHPVIAHEIGHAIGLGHIGEILKTPLCDVAIAAEGTIIERLDPSTQGGRNSLYCYGYAQAKAVVGNIMGAGDSFTVENARPWLWSIGMIRGRRTELAGWRVVTSDPGWGTWVKT
jgi:hypothetical protein